MGRIDSSGLTARSPGPECVHYRLANLGDESPKGSATTDSRHTHVPSNSTTSHKVNSLQASQFSSVHAMPCHIFIQPSSTDTTSMRTDMRRRTHGPPASTSLAVHNSVIFHRPPGVREVSRFSLLPYGSSQLSRVGLEDHMILFSPTRRQPDNHTPAPTSPGGSSVPFPFLLFVMGASVTISIRFPSLP